MAKSGWSLSIVESALITAGWRVGRVPDSSDFPLRLLADPSGCRRQLAVWQWPLDYRPDGRSMPSVLCAETPNCGGFSLEEGWTVLVLVWWEREGVLVAFDPRRCRPALDQQGYLTVTAEALCQAQQQGFAIDSVARGEAMVGMRPEFLPYYVLDQYAVHDLSKSARALSALRPLLASSSCPSNADLRALTEAGGQAVVRLLLAAQEWRFRERVLAAYSGKCAVCGIRSPLVSAIWIVPPAFPQSSDETCNGIALCPHHREAYERAIITIDSELNVLVSQRFEEACRQMRTVSGLCELHAGPDFLLASPVEPSLRPRPDLLELGSQIRGWAG